MQQATFHIRDKPFLDRKGDTFAPKGGNVQACLSRIEA